METERQRPPFWTLFWFSEKNSIREFLSWWETGSHRHILDHCRFHPTQNTWAARCVALSEILAFRLLEDLIFQEDWHIRDTGSSYLGFSGRSWSWNLEFYSLVPGYLISNFCFHLWPSAGVKLVTPYIRRAGMCASLLSECRRRVGVSNCGPGIWGDKSYAAGP